MDTITRSRISHLRSLTVFPQPLPDQPLQRVALQRQLAGLHQLRNICHRPQPHVVQRLLLDQLQLQPGEQRRPRVQRLQLLEERRLQLDLQLERRRGS